MSRARNVANLGADTTNLEDISSAYSAGALSNRNKIINGNFDIWQRGTSGSSGYIADRWTTVSSGSTTAISQQAFTLGQTDVPGEPRFFHRTVVTSVAGASNYTTLIQRIESVRTFAGQTATLSFWAKADAAKNIAVEFLQDFGSGGSPSAAVLSIGVTTIALTTAWQKFTVTVTLPSISGKTLGTGGNDQLALTFWLDAGSDFNARTNSLGQQSGTFDIAQVQLEAGDTATPFEQRSYGQELALCQRYCFATGNGKKYYGDFTTNVGGNAPNDFCIIFPATMRSAPTLSGSYSVSGAIGLGPTNLYADGFDFNIYRSGFAWEITGLVQTGNFIFSAEL